MKSALKRMKQSDSFLILVVTIVYVIVVSIIGPMINTNAENVNSFLSLNNIVLTLRQNAAYGIIACGTAFVLITGNVDFSIGSIYSLVACVCAKSLQQGMGWSIILALAVGLACGIINGVLVGYLKLSPFITTIATQSVFASLAILYSSSGVISPKNDSAEVVEAFKFIGQGKLFDVIPMPILICLIIAVICAIVLKKTSAGAKFYYVGSNRTSARMSGIKTRATIMSAYAIEGLLIGLAALVTVSRIYSAQSQMGVGIELDIILAVVLGGASIGGGKGSILGALIGIIFIGFLQNGFIFMGMDSVYIQKIVSGVILVAALIIDIVRERRSVGGRKKADANK